MPLWIVQNNKMSIGSRVPGEPPLFVAEIKLKIPLSQNNKKKLMWWHRVVAEQLSLFEETK